VSGASDPSIQRVIDQLTPPAVAIGHRLIMPADELALLPEEAEAIGPLVENRRASGAARIAARPLLARFGHPNCALSKDPSGAPIWPAGIIGSLAHDTRVAVAAVTRREEFVGLGIDVEPAEDLSVELLDLVTTPAERGRLANDPFRGKLLFAAKEAVYKAVYPLDRIVLDHHDIEVDLIARKAVVRNGRTVDLRLGIATHLIVLAFLPPDRS
jgi:4'-phosphopantetheinyl transferase EntD